MKNLLLVLFVFVSHLILAQSLQSQKPNLFFAAKPQKLKSFHWQAPSWSGTFFVPKRDLKPTLFAPTNTMWSTTTLSQSFSSTKMFAMPAPTEFTFSVGYTLFGVKPAKVKHLPVMENCLVQAFVPTQSFVPAVTPEMMPVFEDRGIGVTIEKVPLPSVKIPANPVNTLFPNPTTGIFNIELSREATEWKVTNLIGQVVLAQKEKGFSFHDLDISHLPKGTYIASFYQQGKWFSEKLMLVD